ncbi:MAG: response regulator [Deltaproteobacteria bacterium]|nr:response regulator [Deltaproteobacteria bacterium]
MKDIPPTRILYVDDDEDDHILFQRVLHQIPNSYYHLYFKTTHDNAIKWIRQNPCDVLFVDFYLGDKTGLALIKKIQEMGLTMPAIVLTGQSNPDIDTQSLYGGADDYLEKPHLTPVLLDRTIRYALERRRHLSLLTERQSQLERLGKKLLAIQEKERKRLARELHDGIGSTLTAVKYALEENLYYQTAGDAHERPSLESILSWVKQAITETRAICSRLRPETLDDLGLKLTVESLCKKTRQISDGIEILSHVELKDENFPEELKIAVYRILQEAFNNVVKHSDATKVEVSLMETDDELTLSIHDNGIGFGVPVDSKENAGSGFGLESMKERVELLSGHFELQSEPQKGTLITCYWPKS